MSENVATLYLDAGNTRVKIASRNEDGWDLVATGDYHRQTEWKQAVAGHLSTGQLVYTSVSDAFDEWTVSEGLTRHASVRNLRAAEIPAARLDYETPHTLGVDRWLACAGAFSLSRQAVAVCTAGTALTVDLMDQRGVFRGGVIMPGVDAIEASAHLAAPRLPFADVLNPVLIPARSTDDAVDAGARYMLKSALNRILDRYETDYGMIRVWIAGGRGEVLRELIGRECRSDNFLVFRGMEELFVRATAGF